MMLGIPYRANARVKRPAAGSSHAEIVKKPTRRPVKPEKQIVLVKKKVSFGPFVVGPSIDEQFERTNTKTS